MFGTNRSGAGVAQRPGVLAALDVGSSKITCLIARAERGETLQVVGCGSAESEGVRAGGVVDLRPTETAIRAAVEEAERMAGAAVSRVSVAFSGGGLCGRLVAAETSVSVERPVSDRDLRRALDAAVRSFDEPDRVVLHAIPLCWTIDEHAGVRDPRGMFGAMLGVEVLIVSARHGPVRNLTLCIEAAQLDIRAVVAAPYASGLSVLSPDEMALGATVIDMGAGVTAAATFTDGALAHVEVVPIGAGYVSQDIARGLSTPLAAAERLKRAEGAIFVGPEDPDPLIPCPQLGQEDEVSRVRRSALAGIIRPRVEETFEALRDRLKAVDAFASAGQRVVLTGGGALLDGAALLARNILERRVRVAAPRRVEGPDGEILDPQLAAATGLLRHTLETPREAVHGPPRAPQATQRRIRPPGNGMMLARARDWLRECF